MPELPDVEVLRRHVAHAALHRRVESVDVLDDTVLAGCRQSDLTRALRGHELVSTRRRGKQLFVEVSDGPWLTLHFGMTGLVEKEDQDEGLDRHARVLLDFTDGTRLTFVDQRRIGEVGLTDDVDAFVAEHALGPDALSLALPALRDVLAGSRGSLGATLMDQSRIAGIGNVYSDEILFQARLDPRIRAMDVSGQGASRLHHQMRRVLHRAVEAHADPGRMPRTWLIRVREAGRPCPRGRGQVEEYTASGRRAFWCPTCQEGRS